MSEKTTTWVCPECKHEEEWNYETLTKKGEPVCPNCDVDMKQKKITKKQKEEYDELIDIAGVIIWNDQEKYEELIADGIENELRKMDEDELKDFIYDNGDGESCSKCGKSLSRETFEENGDRCDSCQKERS